MRKRLLKVLLALALVLFLGTLGTGFWFYRQLAGSLPQLSGEVRVDGVTNPVRIERDALGVPTIHAQNRTDLAFATGFVHGQDRFFQMDLLRRNSAGELAELVGPAVVGHDREVRVHRFRSRARRVVQAADQEQRPLIEAYVEGVNAGLKSLAKKPFEYLALRVDPAPWQAEDTVLVLFSMYLDLQGEDHADESALALMHDLLPPELFEFLAPRGTEWDAPIEGEPLAVPPIPGPKVVDLRAASPVAGAHASSPSRSGERLRPHFENCDREDGRRFVRGSNNWAVAGAHTRHGGAIVADDMHLGLAVPNIWYRARFVWSTADNRSLTHEITGLTLPGTPAMVVGSNTFIAWGFTNSEGDWVDLVEIEPDPNNADRYLTPDGPRPFERHVETIKVQGAPDEPLEVVSTIWGPVVDQDHRGRRRALRWVAHDQQGVNLNLVHLETATTLDEALRLANQSGAPAQNFVVADRQGQVAWTILGQMPRRVGFDGRLPSSWADGTRRWDGWLAPEEYPRIVNPPGGRIWTANARVVGGAMLDKLGDGGYDLGARAGQIRDRLRALETAGESDMLAIQLDDRAVFLERWRKLLLELLTPEALRNQPLRREARTLVENWGGRAAIDSVGFRLVRAYRQHLVAQVARMLTEPCKKADPRFEIVRLERIEGPVWRLVTQQPPHLLDPRYPSWNEQLLANLDEVTADLTRDGRTLAAQTWGAWNTTRIQHPLSLAVPALARWLDMPAEPLSGDSANMPRIQLPSAGASQRLAVSPGREAEGYCHMPGGQSGHPLSPHYADAHRAWAEGRPTPFLPGPPVHTLVLVPARAEGAGAN